MGYNMGEKANVEKVFKKIENEAMGLETSAALV